MSRRWASSVLLLGLALASGAVTAASCKRPDVPASASPSAPTLRLYLLGTLAGALEPCGCTKDMLGGLDHAAALITADQAPVAPRLVLGAGPLLFMEPRLEGPGRQQDLWKAEAIASSLKELKLSSWAPGANDWAGGAHTLARLREATGARLLAGNVSAPGVPVEALHVERLANVTVGLAGVAAPRHRGEAPSGVAISDADAALARAATQLTERGAQLKVALVALPRGEALRLAERHPAFQLMVVGKPSDAGDSNDAPMPPVMVGSTLVVQPPNHLTAVGVVDYFVRGDSFSFQDAAGISQRERRASLESRIGELRARLASAERHGAAEQDLQARRADLSRAEAELASLTQPPAPEQGSYFRYQLLEVRESNGTDTNVAERMSQFYRRVNEHNREAFKDRRPPALEPGQAAYVGVATCQRCHAAATEFWRTTAHSRAYATLTRQHKEYNLECVSCHVTGYERPGGSTVTAVTGLTDVQCEACHGPGGEHVKAPTDDSRLVKKPAPSLCAESCHHAPHVPLDWSAKDAWPHILGPGHGR